MSVFSMTDYISWGIAIIGIILAVYFYRRSRRFKSIEIKPITETSVIKVSEQISDLKILHKNREIEQLYISEFQVRNSGRIDLTERDFIEPFHCSVGAEIVDSKIVKREPEECDFKIDKCEDNKVFFNSRLFKAGELANIKLTLLAKPNLDFSRNRIADVKSIKFAVPRKINRHLLGFLALIIGLVMSMFVSDVYDFISPAKRINISVQDSRNPINSEYHVSIIMANIGRLPLFVEDGLMIHTRELPARWDIASNYMDYRDDFLISDSSTLILSKFILLRDEVMRIDLWFTQSPSVYLRGVIENAGIYVGGGESMDFRLR